MTHKKKDYGEGKTLRRSVLATALVVAGSLVLGTTASQAGYKMEVSENSWISLGMGMRAHIGAQQETAADGWGKSLAFDNGRIYINGGIMEGLTFEFNTGVTNNGAGGNATDVVMLDAIAKFEFSEAFNIWAGRMLPPSDRANLSGPYYLNTWNGPWAGAAGPQRYTNINAGRDDGAAVWGQFQGGKFKYQAGVFQGNSNSSAPNFAARLTLNLLDPEPGYYNSSTYFGTKDIFAIGVVYQVQSGGADSAAVSEVLGVIPGATIALPPTTGIVVPAAAATTGTFSGWNVDILFEKNLGDSTGTVTLDGAVYGYSNDGGAGAGASDGLGYFALGGFMLPGKVGVGPFKGNPQATIRYEQYRNDNTASTAKRIDAALNWILDGHNAYLTLNYGKVLDTDQQEIILGMQFQY
jgi:hypothetical protein